MAYKAQSRKKKKAHGKSETTVINYAHVEFASCKDLAIKHSYKQA